MYVHIRTRSALRQSRAPNSATQRKRKPMELKTLPIGEQSFVKLRTKNRLYVDKTEFIYRMIQDGTCYFLSRPRRFGKSLLLNTIEAYFQGKKELFEGLYIANQEKEWVKHPVFHLDFSAQSYDSEQKLYNKINTFLTKKEAINLFVDDLRPGNVEQFLQRLQSFFADFQYDAQTTPESHFRNVLYILCKLMGLRVDAEYQTSDGRIDLLLRTDKFVYIIECKIDSTARIALDQIKSKEYALPWSLDNREKILIGLNFSTTTRRPDDWIIERADGSIIEGGKNAREQEREQEGEQVKKQVKEQVKKLVLALGKDTKKREELMQLLQLAGRRNFKQNYIDPSIDEGYMAMLYPEAPNRKDQAYYLTDKGLALLAELTKGW